MSQPPVYTPQHSFVADSATLANFPGQALDVEFQSVKATTDAIETNLALIQRDDGALVNGVVTSDSLSAALQLNGVAPAAPWAAGIVYQVGSPVVVNNTLYRAAIAHTSTVFATDLAAGKWTLISSLLYSAGTNISFAGSVISVVASPTFTNLTATSLTATTLNGNSWPAGTGTLTIGAGKTLNIVNSLSFTGTDGNSFTFPTGSDTVATLGASQTLSNKTFIAPILGAATATSINALSISNNGGGGLSIANATTLTALVSITFGGTASSLTLQGTGTVVNRDSTDTLTNKTFDTAGTGNVFKINGTQITANTGTGNNVLGTSPTIATPTITGATITTSSVNGVTLGGVGQYPGETSTGSASAGNIGEEISQNILSASGVALTSGTPANVATITLSAGDWDIEAQPCFSGGATTQVGGLRASISPTSATENPVSPFFCGGSYGSITAFSQFDVGLSIARTRISLSTPTQYWLVANATFSVSTCKAYGKIRARRVR